jgi:hypothetical protein
MKYPDKFIRGITTFGWLLEDRTGANMNLFAFPSERSRPDGWTEESINWMDDPAAVGFTFSQTDDAGEPKFKVGIAILARNELDTLLKRHPGVRGIFRYERARLPDNEYHGNLLLHQGKDKTLKRMIRDYLALISEIRLREDNQEKK